MALLELPVLGPTEFKTSQYKCGSWSVEFPLHDGDVSVNFYVDGPEMTGALLLGVEKFLADIGDYDRLARAVIRADYASGDDAKSRRFLSYNLENFDPATRLQCFGTDDVSSIGVEHLLAALNPLQVALNPEDQEGIAVFDYILGSGISDQILCIGFNFQGEPGPLCWDS
jgi:hypothetical protein